MIGAVFSAALGLSNVVVTRHLCGFRLKKPETSEKRKKFKISTLAARNPKTSENSTKNYFVLKVSHKSSIMFLKGFKKYWKSTENEDCENPDFEIWVGKNVSELDVLGPDRAATFDLK